MNRLRQTFFYLLIFLLLQAGASDSPDEQKEEFFHKIYKTYNSTPTNQMVWEKALNARKSQSYKVSKGDTLWDISRTLFADGFFWSKVWSLNPYITNPHQITVGQEIQFYPGVGMEPPSLKIKNSTTEETPALAYQPFSDQLPPSAINPVMNFQDIKIPPPSFKRQPALENFPSSIPDWKFILERQKPTELSVIPLIRKYPTAQLALSYYVSEMSIQSVGEVIETEKGAYSATENEIIFIDPFKTLTSGKKYTVVKRFGRIKDPEGGFSPDMVEVQGEITLIKEVNGLFKASINKAIAPIEVGAELIEGSMPTFNMTHSGDLVKLDSTVMGGDFDVSRKLLGLQSILFLNRGSKDGLKAGTRLVVNASHLLRNPNSEVVDHFWPIGLIKLIQVEENYSTAVILESNEPIMPGDFTGSPSDVQRSFRDESHSSSFKDDSDEREDEFSSQGDEQDKDEPTGSGEDGSEDEEEF